MSISKKDPISPKEETEKGCQGFVLGFLKDTLKFCCFPVPAPQDGALSWKETGSKKGGQYKYYCISLASSGDVTVGQVEKGTKKKNPRFSTVTCCFLCVLSRIEFGEHEASLPPCSTFQYSVWSYATKI